MDVPTPRISVIVPVFRNAGDTERLVAGLNTQTLQPHEILLVGTDPQPVKNQPAYTRLIKNPADDAISLDYNLGAQQATGDYILNMQQDCVPEVPQALEKMFRQLTPGRVSVVALVTLPKEVFDQYNFWGKVQWARWVGAVRQGISGKFDLHRREVYESIGGVNTQGYRLSGEDMDLYLRLSERGEVFISDVEIIHYHKQSPNTTFLDVLKKHYKLADSFGELFRRWGFKLRNNPYAGSWSHHLNKYLYLLTPALFLPHCALPVGIVLFIGCNLGNLEAWRIKSWKRIWLLLFNPCSFVVSFTATVIGFCRRPPSPVVAPSKTELKLT